MRVTYPSVVLTLILTFPVSVNGLFHSLTIEAIPKRESFNLITKGMSYDQVLAIVGEPGIYTTQQCHKFILSVPYGFKVRQWSNDDATLIAIFDDKGFLFFLTILDPIPLHFE